MPAKILSAAIRGIDAVPVDIECDVVAGMPSFDTIGLPELSVREARVRVRSAIRHAELPFPKSRVIVNLAPADLRKEGTAYDLPVALAVLMAAGELTPDALNGWVAVGELSLTGSVRSVPGVLAVAEMARTMGLKGIICPVGNVREALAIDGIDVRAATDLAEVVRLLRSGDPWPAAPDLPMAPSPRASLCWSDVRGHALAKRALEVAAGGGHNVAMVGEPGTGKTMLARRLPLILPPLSHAEAIEVTKIHSVAGLLGTGAGLVSHRPFRAPHHTASAAALVGGGQQPRPGESSLAHNGVLFLDELAEFPRQVLDCLRQPLEEGSAVITRGRQTVRFPARFQLVAALNQCACGHVNSPTHRCTCSSAELERYWARLSTPLLDRIDIQIQVPALTPAMLRHSPAAETSATVQARVIAARGRQAERYEAIGGGTNATVPMPILRQTSPLASPVHDLLLRAVEAFGLAPRAHDRIWRVARTIADLEGVADIGAEHIAEALQYRHFDESASKSR